MIKISYNESENIWFITLNEDSNTTIGFEFMVFTIQNIVVFTLRRIRKSVNMDNMDVTQYTPCSDYHEYYNFTDGWKKDRVEFIEEFTGSDKFPESIFMNLISVYNGFIPTIIKSCVHLSENEHDMIVYVKYINEINGKTEDVGDFVVMEYIGQTVVMTNDDFIRFKSE